MKNIKRPNVMMGRVKLILLILAGLMLMGGGAFADIPKIMTYQGKLVSSDATPLTGTYTIIFKIYNAETSGTLLWDETHSGVAVNKGRFNVVLGTTNPISTEIFASDNRWLGITVGTDSEMTPRMKMTGIGWAMRAYVADNADLATNASNLGGLPASSYVTQDAVSGSYVLKSGDTMSGTLNIDGSLEVGNSGTHAYGQHSVAMGEGSSAGTSNDIALGNASKAYGGNSLGANGGYASGTNSFAFGNGSFAQGTNSIALGSSSNYATGETSIVIGQGNSSSGQVSIALGKMNTAKGNSSIAAGELSSSMGTNSIAIGNQASAGSSDDVALGNGARASGGSSVAMQSGTATGSNSFAFGSSSIARGTGSVAIGQGAQTGSDGYAAVAFGTSTQANGSYSMAVGGGSIANGSGAVALGGSTANGGNSLAVGSSSQADGTDSFGIGFESKALTNDAIAMGGKINVEGLNSFGINLNRSITSTITQSNTMAIVNGRVAIGTTEPTEALTVIGTVDATAFKGDGSQLFNISVSDDTRVLKAGDTMTGTLTIDTGATDAPAASLGFATVATGKQAVALGVETVSDGYMTIAAGYQSTASGYGGSFAMGEKTSAGGGQTLAFGYQTTAQDYQSVALGADTLADGFQSFAMGKRNIASNNQTVALGVDSTSSGYQSLAFGDHTTSDNNQSVALGAYTSAGNGSQPFAMGYHSIAAADHAVAFGTYSMAAGGDSFAMGTYSTSTTNHSIAMGSYNLSSGTGSVAMGHSNSAINSNSIALGANNTAEGMVSFTAGDMNRATNSQSVAIGYGNTSTGNQSVAMGNNSSAGGNSSFAMGDEASAGGSDGAIAIGYHTRANNTHAIAMGRASTAEGWSSVSIGEENYSNGNNSIAMGRSSEATGNGSVAIGFQAKATNINAVAIGQSVSAGGWPSIAMGQESSASAGGGAMAAGYRTIATGQSSQAFGNSTYTSGDTAFAGGYLSTAGGSASFAMGAENSTGYNSAPNSMAVGWRNTTTNQQAIAMGSMNRASGRDSMAVGYLNVASGDQSFAMGASNEATSQYSFAGGTGSRSKNTSSFAFGTYVSAEGQNSTAFGLRTKALQNGSVAMGFDTISNADGALALGNLTSAGGYNSIATGYKSSASHYSAIAMGSENTAANMNAMAIGYKTSAGGSASLTSGTETKTTGNNAIATGWLTSAGGDTSTAMGVNMTTGSGAYYSMGIGLSSEESNNISDPNTFSIMGGNVGIGTVSPAEKLVVVGTVDATYLKGDGSQLTNLPATGAGTYVEKAGDTMTGKLTVEVSSGGAAEIGTANIAIGDSSVAIGLSNTAVEGYSIAIGDSNTATGGSSIAIGSANNAIGANSIAAGYASTASGGSSITLGYETSAGGESSIAMGQAATAAHSNTFIWSDGTSPFLTANVQTFILQASGGVGIGTNETPSQLTVKGTIETVGTGGIKFPDESIQITAADTTGMLTQEAADARYVNISGDTMTGNLEIYYTTDELEGLRISNSNWSGGQLASIGFWHGAKGSNYKQVGSIKSLLLPGGTEGDLQFHALAGNVMGEKMVIKAEGQVGIGTTEPASKLHVAGTIETTGTGGIKFPDESIQITAADTTGMLTQEAADARYVNISGDTMTGNLIIGSSLEVGSVVTHASGQYSVALGAGANATGNDSVAMNSYTNASGTGSVAMGSSTTANGAFSLAAGTYAAALDNRTYVWSGHDGTDVFASTKADQYLIRADGGVGINTNETTSALTVSGTIDATAFKGDGSQLTGIVTAGALNSFVAKAGDTMTGNLHINTSLEVGNSTASGANSFAQGESNTASGYLASAMGGNSLASGDMSSVLGWYSQATGRGAHAVGDGSIAAGEAAVAMGNNSRATGDYSFAVGKNTSAGHYGSVAMGVDTTATQPRSIALGDSITVEAQNSVGIGLKYLGGYTVSQANTMAIMGGNVGIGTVSPAETLVVVGTVDATYFKGDGSQLTGIVTSGSFGSYVAKAGDTMTGNLTIEADGKDLAFVLKSGDSPTSYDMYANGYERISMYSDDGNLKFKFDRTAKDVMRIDYTGNVGIGVGGSEPTRTLEVIGIVKANMFEGDGSQLTGIVTQGDVDAKVAKAGDIITGSLTVDSTTLVVNADNHRVGIGTAEPLQKLHIIGNELLSGTLNIGGTSYTGLSKFHITDTAPVGMSIQDNANSRYWITATGSAMTIGGTGTSIPSSGVINIFGGKVGIGTAAPTSELSVNGTIEIYPGSGGGLKFTDGSIQTTAATAGAFSGTYVAKAGDTMVGSLIVNGAHIQITPESNVSKAFEISPWTNSASGGQYAIYSESPVANYSGAMTHAGYFKNSIYYADLGETNTGGSDQYAGKFGDGTNWAILGANLAGLGSLAAYTYGPSYLNGKVSILGPATTSALAAAGTIESTSGGIKFPDSSIQTTAATAGAFAGTFVAKSGDTMTGVLTVDVNANVKSKLYVGDGSPNRGVFIDSYDSHGYGMNRSATGLDIRSGSDTGNHLFISNTGEHNVGIGTDDPQAQLNVMGDISAEGYYYGDGSYLTGVATLGALDTKVSKAGDTMTGNLHINTSLEVGSSTASGQYSVATGNSAVASGPYSVAHGQTAHAYGPLSFVMGNESSATNEGSVAFGYRSSSIGRYSFANGENAVATGNWSFAMGNGSKALSTSTVALGSGSQASGEAAVAIGTDTRANGGYSTALGLATVAGGTGSFAVGNSSKALGSYAIAMGALSTASNDQAIAIGNTNLASGLNSIAMGSQSTAEGTNSIALGEKIKAAGDHTFAIGLDTNSRTASQANSLVVMGGKVGIGTVTPSETLVVIGTVDATYFKGDGSQLTGIVTGGALGSYVAKAGDTMTGTLHINSSLEVGTGAAASGIYSSAIGANTEASGDYSSAIGEGSIATGRGATALGGMYQASNSPHASGESSTSVGAGTKAWGTGASAFGTRAQAYGDNSTAIGWHTTANAVRATAIGEWVEVTGADSFGVGLDQTGRTISKANTFAVVGGNSAFGTTESTDSILVVEGTIETVGTGGIKFPDGTTQISAADITTLLTQEAADARYINIDGDTMTGNLIINGSLEVGLGAAIGRNSVAIGPAFGDGTAEASGMMSIAHGWNSTASGMYSVAMIYASTASGIDAVAIGAVNTASGNDSVILGSSSRATAYGSMVFGTQVINNAARTVAIGLNGGESFTIPSSSSNALVVVGGNVAIGTVETTSSQMVVNGTIETIGTGGIKFPDGTTQISAADITTLLTQEAADARYVNIDGDTMTGTLHISGSLEVGTTGYGAPTATGANSLAVGSFAQASGSFSAAFGSLSEASGSYSIASGYATKATAEGSVAFGQSSKSYSPNSLAMGYNSTAAGSAAFAGGYNSLAIGQSAFAFGSDAQAKESNAIAIGNQVTAEQSGAIAMGIGTVASDYGAIAMGQGNTASQDDAVALGYNTKATQPYAFAAGNSNQANGESSFAMGEQSIADGSYSMAMGYKATTRLNGGIALGANASSEYYDAVAIGPNAIAGDFAGSTGANAVAIGSGAVARGSGSIAIGPSSKATNASTFAFGYNSTAVNSGSMVLGSNNKAGGYSSTTLGNSLTVNGSGSMAIGSNISVEGNSSIGIGMGVSDAVVTSNNVMAIMGGSVGVGTVSPSATLELYGNDYSQTIELLRLNNYDTAGTGSKIVFWQGGDASEVGRIAASHDGNRWALRLGAYSVPEALTIVQSGNVGIGTTDPKEKLHVAGNITAEGIIYGDGSGLTNISASDTTRVAKAGDTMTGKLKIESSFEVGQSAAYGQYSLASGQSAALGDYSIAVGYDSRVVEGVNAAIAMGQVNTSKQHYSTAIGFGNLADGVSSVAMGQSNWTSQTGAVAMGYESQATGPASVALGRGAKSNGESAFAAGYYSVATGEYSVSIGFGTAAKNSGSVAIGYGPISDGIASVALGQSTYAHGHRSLAMGYLSIASGESAAAIGQSNNAEGNYSFAQGVGSNATAHGSVALGESSLASGVRSFAMGLSSIASGEESVALGLSSQTPGYASLAMGIASQANAYSTYALGRRAVSNHNGSFVYSDSVYDADFTSTGNDQFLIRAAGGVGISTTESLNANGIAAQGVIESRTGFKFPDGSTQTTATTAGAFADSYVAKAGDTMSGHLTIEGSSNLSVAGNVGIGVTAPTRTLVVSGDCDGTDPVIDITASGTGDYIRGFRMLNPIMSENNDLMVSVGKSDSAKNMGQFYFTYIGDNSDSNRMSVGLHSQDEVLNVMGSGNVGIGTTDPKTKLNVAGVISSEGMISNILNINGNTTEEVESIRLLNADGFSTAGSASKISFYQQDYDHPMSELTGGFYGSDGNYGFLGFNVHTGGPAWIEAMRIIHNGNVGIGTTDPQEKLHVAGDISAEGNMTVLGNIYVHGTIEGLSPVRVSGGLVVDTIAGDGSQLTGVASAGAVESKVSLDGGTMTGALIVNVANGNAIQTNAAGDLNYTDIQFRANGNGSRVGHTGASYEDSTYGANTMFVENQTANDIRFMQNGTTSMMIKAGGNVGIGNNDPQFTLSTNNGGTVATSILRLQDTWLGTGAWGIQLAGVDNASNGHDLKIQGRDTFDGSFTDYLIVKSSGNVGLGTDTSERLTIGTLSDTRDNFIKLSTGGGSAYKSGIKMRTYDDNYGFTILNDDVNIPRGLHFKYHTNSADGATALFIERDGNGNVGIGTADPGSYKLYVNGNSYFNGTTGFGAAASFLDNDSGIQFPYSGGYKIQLARSGAGTGVGMGVNTGLVMYGDGSNSNLAWKGSNGYEGATVFNVNNDTGYFAGKVGIGTADPGNKLTVAGTIETTAGDVLVNHGSSGGSLFFANDGHGLRRPDSTNDVQTYTTSGRLLFSANTPSESQMTLQSSGNLGIGTTEPYVDLHVGKSTFSGANGTSDNNRLSMIVGDGTSNDGGMTGIMLASTFNNADYANYGLLLVNGSNTENYDVWAFNHDGPASANGGLHIRYANNGTNMHYLGGDPNVRDYLTITKHGNVGIGTAYPTASLEVNGITLTVGKKETDPYGTGRGATIYSGAGDNFTLKTHLNYDNPNITIGFGNGTYNTGEIDGALPNLYINNGYFDFRSTHVNVGQNLIVSGNTGLGVNPPEAKLDVNGASLFRYDVNIANGDTGGGGRVSFRNTDSVADAHIYQANNNLFYIQGNANGINFRNTSGTVTLRLKNDGKLGINNADPSYYLDVDGNARITSSEVYFTGLPVATAIAVNVDGSTGLLSKVSSSLRYKKDISLMEFDEERFAQLRPVRFTWNDKTANPDKKDIGMIAEEVVKIYPELVPLNEKGEPEAVDYSKVSVIAIKAIQEQQKKIDAQQKEIDALKDAVEKLTGKKISEEVGSSKKAEKISGIDNKNL